MIQVNIETIKDNEGKAFLFQKEADLSNTGTEEISFSVPVNIKIEFTSSGKNIQAEGSVEAVIQRPCDRCLSQAEFFVEAPFKETYFPVVTIQEILQDEWIPFKNEVIDIEPEVLKSLFMALPMKILCDQNCQGLCPSCGQNLNIGKCLDRIGFSSI